MARTGYAIEEEGENIARAKASELPVSPKHSIEIARFIRNMKTVDAIAYLEDVVEERKAIPFKRFNRNVGHKRGLVKWDAGRYPRKASLAYLKLIRSVEKNAEYNGLDPEKLKIVHVSANRGRGMKAFFPRAMGRATPKRHETVNIEIVVQEMT